MPWNRRELDGVIIKSSRDYRAILRELLPAALRPRDGAADGLSEGRLLADRVGRFLAHRAWLSTLLLAIVLGGLPLAVWLDLRNIAEHGLRAQADAFTSMVGAIRGYYSTNVVGRVAANHGVTQALPNYADVPGAIPIPATLSLELGEVVSRSGGSVGYRFFSDYPFSNRAPHAFDEFELDALSKLRKNPEARIAVAGGAFLDREVRLIVPVRMAADCVSCHNTHPDSPKKDWKVGDVRGVEEFTVRQTLAANIFGFKYLLGYFAVVALIGLAFLGSQRVQAAAIRRANQDLGQANAFLTSVAQKIAKYLSPQHYKSIFSGEKDVVIATERKKLTIFFSDIVGFTSSAERLQPEEFTTLLNEYLTEMSTIAARHGGSVNKFIGDAILIVFGDIETSGIQDDARACLRMAFEMQARLVELDAQWRRRGIEEPFRARMGINTGFCNVGNFGSEDRMDYTIIGSEANLAARLQSIAQPGGIVLSYEAYMLVREMVRAHALEPITLKGIPRPIVPYEVDGPMDDASDPHVIAEHGAGLDLFMDLRNLDGAAAERARRVLEKAVAALKQRQPG
jgi:adenylate cyclase